MTRRNTVVIAACVVVAVASFLVTVAAQPRQAKGSSSAAVLEWLGASAAQREAIRASDPGFDGESAALMAELRQQRHALAALMEAGIASDQEVLEQVERLSAIEARLERRIAEHVLRIRHHLTSEQQGKLMGLCAQGVRGEKRCLWCADSSQCRCRPSEGEGLHP